jgi:hypothetical protein
MEYFRHRGLEYSLMMGIRTLCVVVAVVLAALNVPYLPLWIALLGLGMVFLPMIAVIDVRVPEQPARDPARPPGPSRPRDAREDGPAEGDLRNGSIG